MLYLFYTLLGFIPLVVGASILVDGASSLARRLRIPVIVIGLTIVAFGTSAPELVVNLIASFDGRSSIVLGNIVGSNIFNILLILGIASIIMPLAVKNTTTWIEIPLALLSAVAVFFVVSDRLLDGSGVNLITSSEGALFILFFLIFLGYNVVVALKGDEGGEGVEIKELTVWRSSLYIVAGILFLGFGGKVIVDNAVVFAASLGIPERIIAITIVSIGTSLPELATSVVAAVRKHDDIAIGNVVGSNIFNVFFILGLSAIVNPVEVSEGALLDIMLNMGASLLLFVFVFTGRGRQLDRWEGGFFIFAYTGYLFWLIYSI